MGIRLSDIFSYNGQKIHIIGCGATGSHIAYILAKSGCSLELWDFDNVNSVNIDNQIYSLAQVGKNKAEALRETLSNLTEKDKSIYEVHACKTTAKDCKFLSGYVFICVDTMDTRKELWKTLKYNTKIIALYDMRMGIDFGRVYTCNLKNRAGYKTYDKSMYDSSQVASMHIHACHKTAVGATAIGLASLCAWAFYQTVKENKVPASTDITFDWPDIYNEEVKE